jgi:hypothetical protein
MIDGVRIQTLELIEMTLLDKLNIRLQKYRLTSKGREMMLTEVKALVGGKDAT